MKAMTKSMLNVLREIGKERQRQVKYEGHTAEHDDSLCKGELAEMASAYASNEEDRWRRCPAGWEFKPTERKRELIKAAALLVAEIERIERKEDNLPKLVMAAKERICRKKDAERKEKAMGTEKVASFLMEELRKVLEKAGKESKHDTKETWVDAWEKLHAKVRISKNRGYSEFPADWLRSDHGQLLRDILDMKLKKAGVEGSVESVDITCSQAAEAEFVLEA